MHSSRGDGAKYPKPQEAPADPTQPTLNARTALLGLFVALTIVLASTTVYESGTRTTLTSTSTSTIASTNTLTSTLTQTTTVTSTTLSSSVPYGFDFITASGNCDGGNAPCWGQPAYVFNCAPSLFTKANGEFVTESCSQVVVSDVFPYPVYGISITSYSNQSEPWANCAYQVGLASEVGAYCVLLNSTAFILGEPATPPPSTSEVHSSSAAASIHVPAASVSRLDPETGLSLTLNLTATANQTITFTAYDVNTLDRSNNLTTAERWPVPSNMMNDVCSYGMVVYVVYQGDYSVANYTQGTPLSLSQSYIICNSPAVSYYVFSPMSMAATIYYAPNLVSGLHPTPVNASISATLFGFWVTDSAHPQGGFLLFPPGTYTVAAADEWGGIVLSHFTVQG